MIRQIQLKKWFWAVLFLTWAVSSMAKIADPNTYLADTVGELQKKWPKNQTINIVCYGHSVPAGYFATPVVDTFNAYPCLMHRGLKERFPFAVINVIVAAIGGENSIAGAARFESDVLTHKPNVVLIDYALNDRVVDMDKVRDAWIQMIQQAKAKDCKVILLTPTGDTNAKLDDPDDPLNKHAEQIRSLAAEYDVGLVDSLAAFNKYIKSGGQLKDLMSQPNHPNRKGHDLVTAELLKWFPKSPNKK